MRCNAFIRLARAHELRVFSWTKGAEYRLDRAAGRKELRNDVTEAEYESDHRGERVALARKRQARNGDYGGGVRPYGWGVDSGRVRSVCVNPKAPAMERRYEDRPVLDMTRHSPAEAAEIRRWADDLLSGVSMNQILRDLADRGVPTVAMTDGRVGAARREDGRPWRVELPDHPADPHQPPYVGPRGVPGADRHPQRLRADPARRYPEALITLFSDPARKTSPGNTPKWLGSLIYRCGKCGDGTTMSVRRNTAGTPVYRCRAAGHCAWPAVRTDAHVENVIVERLSRPDVADLLPRETDADVAALREELIVLEARKNGAAQMYARRAIDEEQLGTITAEAARRIGASAPICRRPRPGARWLTSPPPMTPAAPGGGYAGPEAGGAAPPHHRHAAAAGPGPRVQPEPDPDRPRDPARRQPPGGPARRPGPVSVSFRLIRYVA